MSSDHHLLPRFRKVEPTIVIPTTNQEIHTAAGGDHIRLRGIPCIAYGVGGAQMGSRPEREVLKLDKRDAA